MILRLRYIKRFRDRHGVMRTYLRRKGFKAVALPDRTDPGFLDAYRAALAASEPVKPKSRVAPQSLEDLSRRYRASPAFVQLRASTQANYGRILTRLLRDYGHLPVRTLEPANVRAIVRKQADTPAAANHTLRILRAMMIQAIEDGWRIDDPTREVRRLKTRNEGVVTWTEEDIAQFEAHWPAGSKPRLALALLVYTGQRRSDVVRMGRQHIRGSAIEVRQVKTKARLLIPLHSELARLLARETDRLTFLMTDEGAGAKPYTPNGFYMRFAAWVQAAGLPAGLSPHGLRKAAARRIAEAGGTAHQISAVTGHRTLSEVQRYTVAADQVRLAEQAMEHVARNEKRR